MLPKIFTHILVILLNFRFNSIEFLKLHENAINHAKCNINEQLINIYLNNTEKLMIMIKNKWKLSINKYWNAKGGNIYVIKFIYI